MIDNARQSAKDMPGRPLAIALDTVREFYKDLKDHGSDRTHRKDQRSELATHRVIRTYQSRLGLS